MAAVTFPAPVTYIADLLRVPRRTFTLMMQQEVSGLGSGQIIAADIAPPLWVAEIETKPMSRPDANLLLARLDTLEGSLNSFYLYDPWKCAPFADPGGVKLGGSTPKIYALEANNKEMRLYGLPAGYILTAGDYLAFDYGSNPARRALHRVTSTVTADNSGITPMFEVRPHIRSGAQTDINVTLVKAAAKMIIEPGSLRVAAQSGLTVISFRAIQRIP